MVIKLIITGRPVPAVRMTQKSKYADPQAKRYLAYKELVGWEARIKRVKPIDGDVEANIKIYLCGGNQGDIDNYAKSLTDSLNKIAYKDDRQIKRLVVEKLNCPTKEEQRAEIEIRRV